MTTTEFDWMKRAMETLESGEVTQMARLKILKTMSQICAKSASDIEYELAEAITEQMDKNRLVDILVRS